jgi:hypothetical protein
VRYIVGAVLFVAVFMRAAGLGSAWAGPGKCNPAQSASKPKRAFADRPLAAAGGCLSPGTQSRIGNQRRGPVAAPHAGLTSSKRPGAQTRNSHDPVSARPTLPTDARTRENAKPTQALQDRLRVEEP